MSEQSNWKEKVDSQSVPEHIAIIMDGNGRWAKRHGRPRIFGHKAGVKAVREVTEGAAEIGVKYMTLYAFSTENWNRPRFEVNALMTLLVETLHREVSNLDENNIRLKAIGDLDQLPERTRKALEAGMLQTQNNDRMTLILALNYSSQWEIIEACKNLAIQSKKGELEPNEITEKTFRQALATSPYPDPELLIRTSGEYRISNFLLYQIAYSELYFTSKFWPEFAREDLYQAIVDYQQRERRFGKTSEQVN